MVEALPEKADFASSAGHWYDAKTGEPRYTVIGANRKERPTTLRDARKFSLVPGTNTVIALAYRYGLEHFKQEQLLMSALTLPRRIDAYDSNGNEIPGETEAEWIARVWQDSKEQAKKAAERGIEIHAAIEKAYRGELVPPALAPWVGAAKEVIADSFGDPAWSPERSFAHPLGYGGKVDLHAKTDHGSPFEVDRIAQDGLVIDIKTKDGDIETIKPYDETIMQLAAYAHGLGMPDARCAVLFVSRTVAAARLVTLEPEQVRRGWEMFTALLAFWQTSTGYVPTAA